MKRFLAIYFLTLFQGFCQTVKVTVGAGGDAQAAGFYNRTLLGNFSKGPYKFISDGGGEWELARNQTPLEDGTGVGTTVSPSTVSWTNYTVTLVGDPGEITSTPPVVTNPGTINPGLSTSAPSIYLGTFAQALSSTQKAQALTNLGIKSGTGPIRILAYGQSNEDGGRAGGDQTYNPDVKIWNISSQAWEGWNVTTNPRQWGNTNYNTTNSTNPPSTNTTLSNYIHLFAGKLQKLTQREVQVMVFAESATALNYFVSMANGGLNTFWQGTIDEFGRAGWSNADIFIFGQGESGAGSGVGTYAQALALVYGQLDTAGYLTPQTVCLGRSIKSPTANGDALRSLLATRGNSFFRRKYEPHLVR